MTKSGNSGKNETGYTCTIPASRRRQFPRHRVHLHPHYPNIQPTATPLRTEAPNLSWVGIATVRTSSFFNFLGFHGIIHHCHLCKISHKKKRPYYYHFSKKNQTIQGSFPQGGGCHNASFVLGPNFNFLFFCKRETRHSKKEASGQTGERGPAPVRDSGPQKRLFEKRQRAPVSGTCSN